MRVLTLARRPLRTQVDAEEFFAFVNTAQERAASDRLFKQLDRSGDGCLSPLAPQSF